MGRNRLAACAVRLARCCRTGARISVDSWNRRAADFSRRRRRAATTGCFRTRRLGGVEAWGGGGMGERASAPRQEWVCGMRRATCAVLPHQCENKRQFLHAASRELQLPEENNEQAFFSGFSAPPRTEVRGSPKCRVESSVDLLKDYGWVLSSTFALFQGEIGLPT